MTQKVGVNPYLEFTGRSVSLSDTISFSLPIISIYHNNGKKKYGGKTYEIDNTCPVIIPDCASVAQATQYINVLLCMMLTISEQLQGKVDWKDNWESKSE